MPARRAAAVILALFVAGCSEASTAVDDRRPSPTATPSSAATLTTTPSPTSPGSTAAPPTQAPPTTAPPSTTEPASQEPLVVETDLGVVRGITAAEPGVRSFLAIPYAEAPVGDLRFAPPATRRAWIDDLDATAPGASCPQIPTGATAQFTVIPEWDDDCLTLSVWTPDDAETLPVMVWFHGGSFVNGSAHQPYYIGDQLAARGAVVVGVNYRLGPLGFLDGNWGLLDQAEALDWVQRNVAAFGGDPARVTIFGESAGGFSVCGHLGSDPGPVFAQAIIQSGGGCDRLQPADETAAATTAYLGQIGCADLACARSQSTEDLLAVPFDGTLVAAGDLTRSAYERAVAAELPPRPIVTGYNSDEATLFTLGLAVDDEAALTELVGEFTDDPIPVLDLYPADQFEDPVTRYRELWTDVVFACPAVRFAGESPGSHVYEFSYVSASTPFDLGATHGAELAYLFGHPEGLTLLEADLDPADAAVSERMQGAWVEFATTGSPGWPQFDGSAVLDIGVDDVVVDVVRNGRCEDLLELIAS